MSTVLTIVRNNKRITSLLTLSIVFLFLAGANPYQETHTTKTNFLKRSNEFATPQLLDSPKENSVRPVINDFLFNFDRGEIIPGIALMPGSLRELLKTNSFQRNVFYVYISINAP